MTMARSEQHKRGPREKELRKFHEKLNLNETAQQQQKQQADLQWQLLKNRCHTAAHEGDGDGKVQYNQYSEVHGRMEEPEDALEKDVDGCVNHLLILAQSAEIVAQSEDSLIGVRTDNQNEGSNNNLVDLVSRDNDSNVTADDSCENSQTSEFCYKVTRPRVTQIRKQARHKCHLLDQERIEDNQQKDVHGKTIRLSQIKHQLRCKSRNDLILHEVNAGHGNEKQQAKMIRLNQMKHLARLKGKSTIAERTEEHMDGRVHCNKFGDNKKEKTIASQFERGDICQGATAYSEREKEIGSAKGRMRLTHLRHEVRLGNQFYIRLGPAEN